MSVPRHVIFDFNGTLLDDAQVMLRVENEFAERANIPPLDLEMYRRKFRRPIREYIEEWWGNVFTDDEWIQHCDEWIARYEEIALNAELFPDTHFAVKQLKENGYSISVLSMHLQTPLLLAVERHGLADYFVRVDGMTPSRLGQTKHQHLADHLDILACDHHVDIDHVVMIGDSLDDGHSALDKGIDCILVATGTTHFERLAELDLPVVNSLTEAVALIN